MDAEITPEPTSGEREALERALQELDGAPADARGPWWREGLCAELEGDQSQSS
ncbi:MAG TPA: hypothetical protein VD704_04400 [Gaiellaceae bacterium]|nr:hypothetical protein [Gaiellaceae bacterium]